MLDGVQLDPQYYKFLARTTSKSIEVEGAPPLLPLPRLLETLHQQRASSSSSASVPPPDKLDDMIKAAQDQALSAHEQGDKVRKSAAFCEARLVPSLNLLPSNQ